MTASKDDTWKLVRDAVRRLDEAWQVAANPPFPDLPPLESGLRQPVLVALIKADLSRRWRTGDRKQVEQYLTEWPELCGKPAIAKELLEEECLTRAAIDSLPTRDELRSRFPEVADEIDLETIANRARRDGPADRCESAGDETPSAVGGAFSSETIVLPAGESGRMLSRGCRLGAYEVIELLGEGAMGAVYLAQDLTLPRRVAIKVPHGNRFHSPEDSARFLEEAGAVARLNHPGIVTIYHVGEANGKPHIVMEYVEGGSLKSLLGSSSGRAADVAAIMAEIADAVHYAHQQGFVHRDLKPSNVLLDTKGRPHVVDFGLALHESSQRGRAGESAGTLPYMAPEQVRGESHRLDGRADIWALGVMLYEMLAGRRPFSGDTPAELRDEILNRNPKPPRQLPQGDDVPPALERICLKCLCKDVAQRYSTAWDLAEALRGVVADAQPSTSKTGLEAKSVRHRLSAQLHVGRVGCGLSLAVMTLLVAVSCWWGLGLLVRNKSTAILALSPSASPLRPKPNNETNLCEPRRGETARSFAIEAEADYLESYGRMHESLAVARKIHAESYSKELDNWIKFVEVYWKREALYRQAYREAHNSEWKLDQERQERMKQRVAEQYRAVLRGGPDITRDMNWVLREISNSTISYQLDVGDKGVYQAEFNPTLSKEELKHIQLKEGRPGEGPLVFSAADGYVASSGWPAGLRGNECKAARDNFDRARDAVFQEARSTQKISDGSRVSLIRAIDGLFVALDRAYPREKRQQDTKAFSEYTIARQCLRSYVGTLQRTISSNDASALGSREQFQGGTLVELIQYMYRNGLEFAPPKPGAEGLYRNLFEYLRQLYIRVGVELPSDIETGK
jgi:serine/threonine protein kinase